MSFLRLYIPMHLHRSANDSTQVASFLVRLFIIIIIVIIHLVYYAEMLLVVRTFVKFWCFKHSLDHLKRGDVEFSEATIRPYHCKVTLTQKNEIID